MRFLLRQLSRNALLSQGRDLTDAQLLESFLSRREESAFEALLHRHGPMVLGVCRRVLGDAQDAEDAFQATFLVLVRKAASIRPREQVGPWLHGVAYRTALKMRALAGKRRERERAWSRPPEPEESAWEEWLPLLDRELSRLPEKYRAAVVLCELQGKSRKEAAGLLRLPEGTLSSRLATARKMLAKRLSLSSALAAGILTGGAAAQAAHSVSPALLSRTLAAVNAFRSRPAVAVGSSRVELLAQGVLKAMLVSKLKVAAVVVLIVALVGAGVGALAYRVGAQEQPAPQKEAKATRPEDKAADKDGPTPRELIQAATTPDPSERQRDPVLPVMSSSMRGEVEGEILASQAVRAAYARLDVRKRNTTWFEGVAELEKAKAVWCLASCLCHPHPDVQIHALRGLRRLGDRRAVPFVVLYAEYMAIIVGGSENATIHGIIHQQTADTLSSLTGVRVRLKGQNPEGLLRGVRRWRKWLCENEETPRAGRQEPGTDKGWSLTATVAAWEGKPYVKVFLVSPPGVSEELTDRGEPAFLLSQMCDVRVDDREGVPITRGDIVRTGSTRHVRPLEGKTLLGALAFDAWTAEHFGSDTPALYMIVSEKDRLRTAAQLPAGKHTLTIRLKAEWAQQIGSRVAPAIIKVDIPEWAHQG